MTAPGFEDVQASYAADPKSLIGTFRRLGEYGPTYEILDVDPDGNVKIEMFETEERVTQKLTDVLNDPIAKTLP